MPGPQISHRIPCRCRYRVFLAALLSIKSTASRPNGHEGAKQLATYFVGQVVGLMNAETSAREVVYEFMRDFAEAVQRLNATVDG